MAKTNKKTGSKRETVKRVSEGTRIARMFNLPRRDGRNPPEATRFSRVHQPKKRGRPPGAQNLFTRQIKEAAVAAAERYGCDGKGTGGLEGFLFRLCDLHPQTMAALLGRIMPVQKDADGERKKTVYETPEQFDEALKARGLPSLTHMLALEFEAGIKTIDGTAEETKP